ncbi:hypothetical protein J27TS7_56990 [Paenibacillus dendritiformis]|nr:hypothetical protein J27TS7_56990 [Paenibacillus dendritiformis]
MVSGWSPPVRIGLAQMTHSKDMQNLVHSYGGMIMKKGIGKRAKEILRKLLQGRGMRRLAIGLALLIPAAGYAGDASAWPDGEQRPLQSLNAAKEGIPASPRHASENRER